MMRLLAATIGVMLCGASARANERPNILFIYTDDHSHRFVSCYPEAHKFVKTPNLDRLAREGVRFVGAYNGSWCAPSRATILTGKHPYGVESMRFFGTYPNSEYDPKVCRFWPSIFRQRGYVTAMFGKWHTGIDAGFGRDWDRQIVWNRPRYPKDAASYFTDQLMNVDGGPPETVKGYSTDNYTRWAAEFIRGKQRDASRPWFLWVCYGATHGPITPAERHKGLYAKGEVTIPADVLDPRANKPAYVRNQKMWRKDDQGRVVSAGGGADEVGDPGRKTLADLVRQCAECGQAIDEGVGELLKALEDSGQAENTLVVFTSDQGMAYGQHGFRSKVAPYEGTLRSPLIVRHLGKIPQGRYCPVPASGVDFAPTFFAQAGFAQPWEMHGRDLSPLFKNPDAAWPHVTLFTNTGRSFGSDTHAIPKEFPAKEQNGIPWWVAVRQGQWKYIRNLVEGEVEELYDLAADADELTNLAYEPRHRETLTRLREAMFAELRRTNCGFAGRVPAAKGETR